MRSVVLPPMPLNPYSNVFVASRRPIVPAHAADRRVVGLDGRGGREILKVFLVPDAVVIEEGIGECRDRDRRILDRRLLAFRRDDDFLDLPSLSGVRRRRHWQG
ncbi:MAG: hypothetical protein U5O39_06400 [Gammaproteobacteria bacterium]|nr:hypothetical protein [Gammaproteobacteria bacterium]